jgi:hypothetical protein
VCARYWAPAPNRALGRELEHAALLVKISPRTPPRKRALAEPSPL